MDPVSLAEAQRIRQVRAVVPVMRALEIAASRMDPTNLDGSFTDVLRIALPVIGAGRAQSNVIALDYYRAARILAGIDPEDSFPDFEADPLDIVQVSTSLHATGPGYVKSSVAKGTDVDTAIRLAQAAIIRAGKRHALNAGRGALMKATRADKHSRGWSRVSDGKPCHFCAMLVSRGPVYTEKTVRFRSHDGCGCGVAAVFNGQDGWTPQARAIRAIYDDNPGSDFRSAWERHLREPEAEIPAAA